jgi:hypothetical protein
VISYTRAMKILLPLPIAAALAGCAASAAGLERTAPRLTIESARPPAAFATCAAEAFLADNQLRTDGSRWWVLRMNGWGVPVVRWDFEPRGSGSVAILRATSPFGEGADKVRACAV